MSQSITKSSSTGPLTGAKSFSQQDSKITRSTPTTALNMLAMGRIGLGASTLIAPTFTFSLFKLALPSNMTLIARMFAGRELVVGEWTWLAKEEDKNATEAGRRSLKSAIKMNTAVDAIDFAAASYALATGAVGRLPGSVFAAGALSVMALDLWALSGLKES